MKIILLTSILVLTFFIGKSQPISPNFFGQNAWMPSWAYGGKLDNIWQKAKSANFGIIRIGGIEYEDNFDQHITDFIRMIDSIKLTCHAEPILQIPRTYTDQQVRDLFETINVKNNRNIKYWSIGNEPDSHKPNTSAEISAYFIRIAKVLKDKDKTLIVIGPDFANYWVHPGDIYDSGKTSYSTFINSVGMQMNTNNTAYLLDVFSFHNYVGYTIDKTLDNQDIERVVDNIKLTLNAVNDNRTLGIANKASWGIGEFNISNNDTERRTPWSFYNGQYFAMMFDLGMKKEASFICPWSMIEGEWRKGSDLSMFENDANANKPRSTFYHVKMLSENKRSNYMKSTSSIAGVKSIGMKDVTGLTIMLLNTSESISYNTTIKLDTSSTSANDLIINTDAGINNEYKLTLQPNETVVLLFDNQGFCLKKINYSKADADAYRAPTYTTILQNVNQTINFPPLPVSTFGDVDFNAAATASSELPCNYFCSNALVATISATGNITINGAGTTTISITQPGNATYSAAATVTQVLTVNRKTQSISFNSLPIKSFGDIDFAAGATASSGLSCSLSSSDETVAKIVNGLISIIGQGTAIITASQSGNANYIAASPVSQILTVVKQNQTIAFEELPTKIFGMADFDLTASASSNLPIYYTSSNKSVATITGSNTIHIVGEGDANITAMCDSTYMYNEAASLTQVLHVVANQLPVLSFATPPTNSKLIQPATIVVQVNATDADGIVTNVKLYVNGNILPIDKDGTWIWNENGTELALTDMLAGSYTLTAVATDNLGGVSQLTEDINVITTPITTRIEAETAISVSKGIGSQRSTDIFPNPAENFVTINAGETASVIYIFNSIGEKVYSVTDAQNTITVPINQIGKKGLYFIYINGNTKKLFISK